MQWERISRWNQGATRTLCRCCMWLAILLWTRFNLVSWISIPTTQNVCCCLKAIASDCPTSVKAWSTCIAHFEQLPFLFPCTKHYVNKIKAVGWGSSGNLHHLLFPPKRYFSIFLDTLWTWKRGASLLPFCIPLKILYYRLPGKALVRLYLSLCNLSEHIPQNDLGDRLLVHWEALQTTPKSTRTACACVPPPPRILFFHLYSVFLGFHQL